MTVDVPNAFVQTDVNTNKDERIKLKSNGPLVDMLVAMDPEKYADFVVYEVNIPVLYVEALKALYGMLESSLIFLQEA
jgi:hypothetical protein